MNQKTLIFLGPQGCGKGTQVTLFKKYLSEQDPGRRIVHFEMGKHLRELAQGESYTAELVAATLAEGRLVDYFITEVFFGDSLIREMKGDEHLLIDGYPRMHEQVASLDSALQFYKREQPTIVLINISDEVALARLLGRGRPDDNEENIRKRLAWSRAQTIPNIEWFRTQPGYRVIDIDGSGSIEETHQAIVNKLV
jgi:adenylate kinase